MKPFNSTNQIIKISLILIALTLASCTAAAVTDEQLDPQQTLGKRVFRDKCAACHANSGETVIVGPSLAGIATRGGERIEGYSSMDYISESIMNPGAYIVDGYADLMPAEFGLTLTGEEFDALTAYLLTLK